MVNYARISDDREIESKYNSISRARAVEDGSRTRAELDERGRSDVDAEEVKGPGRPHSRDRNERLRIALAIVGFVRRDRTAVELEVAVLAALVGVRAGLRAATHATTAPCCRERRTTTSRR